MGENLSKKTPNQNLAHGTAGDEDGGSSAIDLTHTNFRPAFQSLSFNILTEFTGLPLEMDDEVANTMIESKSGLCRDKTFTSTFKEYFNFTSNTLESFRLPTLLDPTSGKNLLKDFFEKHHSLEQRLQTYNSKIHPKMATYRILQVAVTILVILPVIGPITWSLLVGDKLHAAVVAVVASFAFIAFGVAGKFVFFFFKRKKEELKVKEVVISLMLISITYQKEKLNRISDLINWKMLVQDHDVISKAVGDLHDGIGRERKTILQKLSEYKTSSGANTLEKLV